MLDVIAPNTRIVDVGGYGTLLTALLRGVLDRCELVEGDFFAAVPTGGDIYILSRVLMDHDDARSRQLLQNCYDAMAEHGRLLIVQQVLPDDTGAAELFDGAMSDLNMLIFLPGCERTLGQYRALLSATKFVVTNVIPTRALMSIVEAARIASSRVVAAPSRS